MESPIVPVDPDQATCEIRNPQDAIVTAPSSSAGESSSSDSTAAALSPPAGAATDALDDAPRGKDAAEKSMAAGDDCADAAPTTGAEPASEEELQKRRAPAEACVFVAGMPPQYLPSALEDFLSAAGEVLKVTTYRDKRSRPYAFVQFATTPAADKLLAGSFDGLRFEGRQLRFERARMNCTLQFAGLPPLAAGELQSLLSAFGELSSLREPPAPGGLGYATYKYRDDAAAALSELKKSNPEWAVEWSTSRRSAAAAGSISRRSGGARHSYGHWHSHSRPHGRGRLGTPAGSSSSDERAEPHDTLFVGGLDDSVTEYDLHSTFSRFGDILKVTMLAPPRHRLPLSAFVRFSTVDAAQAAILGLHRSMLKGRRIRVQFADSGPPRHDRRRMGSHAPPAVPPMGALPADMPAPPMVFTPAGWQAAYPPYVPPYVAYGAYVPGAPMYGMPVPAAGPYAPAGGYFAPGGMYYPPAMPVYYGHEAAATDYGDEDYEADDYESEETESEGTDSDDYGIEEGIEEAGGGDDDDDDNDE
eukprot:PLAT7420.1.p1 GENE.PLAT7420.1~~PLAT7420.1.p1  ORF type:complete len:558 (+),score=202.71 PLAT7420.1:84-1676(+)